MRAHETADLQQNINIKCAVSNKSQFQWSSAWLHSGCRFGYKFYDACRKYSLKFLQTNWSMCTLLSDELSFVLLWRSVVFVHEHHTKAH